MEQNWISNSKTYSMISMQKMPVKSEVSSERFEG